MPIIPMLPANEVRIVRPFLVKRFLSDSENEVASDIDGFFASLRRSELLLASASASRFASVASSSDSSASLSGAESPVILPSRMLIIRVE